MKKFIIDSLINIFASLIVVFSLQFVVLPILGKDFGIEYFGYILIVLAIRNVLVQILGGTLNNFHLINLNKFEELEVRKIYNSILLFSLLLGCFITCVALKIVSTDHLVSPIIILGISIAIFNGYFNVYLRKELLYKKILVNQILISVGFFVGLSFYILTNNWEYILLIPELMSLIYLLFYLKKINYTFSLDFKSNSIKLSEFRNKYLQLLSTSLINNTVNYLERFIFIPILGVVSVSQYYIATLTPKSLSLGITPLNGVILTYVMKSKKKITINLYLYIFLVLLIFLLLINFALYYISPLILSYLYPNYISDIYMYIYMGNLAISLGLLSNLFNPIVLKVAGIKAQMKVSLQYGFIYLVLGICGTIIYGLMGFIISVLISNIVKFLLLFYTGFKTIQRT